MRYLAITQRRMSLALVQQYLSYISPVTRIVLYQASKGGSRVADQLIRTTWPDGSHENTCAKEDHDCRVMVPDRVPMVRYGGPLAQSWRGVVYPAWSSRGG